MHCAKGIGGTFKFSKAVNQEGVQEDRGRDGKDSRGPGCFGEAPDLFGLTPHCILEVVQHFTLRSEHSLHLKHLRCTFVIVHLSKLVLFAFYTFHCFITPFFFFFFFFIICMQHVAVGGARLRFCGPSTKQI